MSRTPRFLPTFRGVSVHYGRTLPTLRCVVHQLVGGEVREYGLAATYLRGTSASTAKARLLRGMHQIPALRRP